MASFEIGTTKVFLEESQVDPDTLKQIRAMTEHPAIVNARVMPDCHHGSGCCVGFTSQLNDKIVPNFVGGDIGCGMLAYRCDKVLKKKEKTLDKAIRRVVPVGAELWDEPCVDFNSLETVYQAAREEALHFTQRYLEKFNVQLTPPTYDLEWHQQMCQRIGSDINYDMRSLGTLGGGNHFIEINEHDSEGYIIIHSGSRHLGKCVNAYHQSIIDQNKPFDWDTYYDQLNTFKKTLPSDLTKKQKKKIVHEFSEKLKAEQEAQKHDPYLEGQEAYDYYFAMIFAQKIAVFNRRLMLINILEVLSVEYDSEQLIESVHNYIDFRDLVMRKGAIGAHDGEMCLIGLNMRDGVLLCRGKGNGEWNYSAAHGSGRIITRKKAFQKLRFEYFKKSMEGIYSTSVLPETLDESPMVYKDSEMIKQALDGTVEILAQLRPVLNIKGT